MIVTNEIRVECFILCDGAQECGGKLYILGGGWDELRGQSFPLVYQFALAIRLSVPWIEANRAWPFRIEVVDDDNRDILPKPLQGEFNVGRPPAAVPGDELPVVLAITMADLAFPAPGRYTFLLRIGGEEKAKARLRIRKIG